VSGGGRQNAADTKLVPVNGDDTPHTAAEMRSLADQAEAEAAEAEALAAAARARARAIQLRREAEVVEAKEQPATQEAVSEEAVLEEAVLEDDEANPADSVATEVQDTPKIEPEATESADKPEDVETEVEKEKVEPDDAVAEADADTSAADDAAEKPARRWPRRLHRPKWSTVAAALAVVVILAALSGSVYMVLDHRHATQQRQRAAEFAAAARQGVVTLTSMDFNNAKEGVQRIADDSTGTFRDDFLKMADDFIKVVEQSKVVSQGTVQAAAVDLDTMTDNSAVVLVASTSEITNAAGAKQDPRTYRLIVTIARDGKQLKMSKVEFVP
jgi:Mce-associated membrane protein